MFGVGVLPGVPQGVGLGRDVDDVSADCGGGGTSRAPPEMVPATRVRLDALTARMSHAALAVNVFDGGWVRMDPLPSAKACSLTLRPRWVLSALPSKSSFRG